LGAALPIVVDSSWRSEWPGLHRAIQWTGLMLIGVCIFGRTWCTLYIGGLELRELLTTGLYSLGAQPALSLHPARRGRHRAAGIGALLGSVTMAGLSIAFAAGVFAPVDRRELATFPHELSAYAARVPRLLPRFSACQQANQLIVKPWLVHRTFFDARLFLLAMPLIAIKALARDWLWLPILLYLP